MVMARLGSCAKTANAAIRYANLLVLSQSGFRPGDDRQNFWKYNWRILRVYLDFPNRMHSNIDVRIHAIATGQLAVGCVNCLVGGVEINRFWYAPIRTQQTVRGFWWGVMGHSGR